MSAKQVSFTHKQYTQYIEEIHKHDRLYFLEAKPVISDYEYDQLVKKVEEMEKMHPEWIDPSSPTQRLTDQPSKGFIQVKHTTPMLSLSNTYSQEEVEDFIKRMQKWLGPQNLQFCTELKMDGVAITVCYQDGKLLQALTRGDGKVGDDITANIKAIRSIPLCIKTKKRIEVRGEVFMLHRVFQKLNQSKVAVGDELWANPRNAAAGSLKLLDANQVAKRSLSAVFYAFANEAEAPCTTQYDCHHYLKSLGLPSFSDAYIKRCHTADEIMEFAKQIEKKRHHLAFDIDGIVVKIDLLKDHAELGVTGKSPRWAIAYKFAPEQAETKIRDITVQVGRTGVLTPVAELEPVLLAGSTIARATLHNREEIERKDIRIKDYVIIEKGGDVIPKVLQVNLKKRIKSSTPWDMPHFCPSCGSKVVQYEGEVAMRCPNTKNCPEQVMRKIFFFASKDAMNIEHLGDKVTKQLIAKKLIRSVADLYQLTKEDLAQLEGFKEKSIQNLLNSIDKSRHVSLDRFILALGIKYVGEGSAELLAQAARTIDRLLEMHMDELRKIQGIGEKTAIAVVEYFKDPNYLQEIKALLEAGVKPQSMQTIQIENHYFANKIFVLTGTLKEYSRIDAALLIKERGGRVTNSVSRNTDYLLIGEDPGSKLAKAQEYKVHILNEQAFKKLL
ncbi:DNA ligase [Candidatus Rhabdochlamydia oedothoracis]|uniref:DNA ligase n=1 Tax=Candidatus Rhabdochlamydia oedothoracis TaxID=2720720 RepID=A0ABX8V646_9BACT|nr:MULTISPECIES: NAD-dependent DNA ligase LigA [Rhabdochlamydia]KAG6559607.1 DNA ligase [Candidatus Rhabdochlamydia sp. W815]MCL6756368.1 NAD-dependent DNA ligase LigA [Candidatus Rhabdochlamydia oedothoracis]QYF48503.1 DNA ligase [Candidatus Rhabdochlamydia oedothoracis]